MAYGDLNKWTPPGKSEGIPGVRTRLSMSVENEQTVVQRDGQTRLARPNSQARNEDREIFIFFFQLTTSRIGNLTRLIHTLLHVMTIHTYILLPPGFPSETTAKKISNTYKKWE